MPPLFYFSPDDFHDSTLAIDVPDSPSGTTVLVIVPAALMIRSGAATSAELGVADDAITIDSAVDAISVADETHNGRIPVPISRSTIAPWVAPIAGPPHQIGIVRDFSVNGVLAEGRQMLDGNPYVYFEDVDDRMTYSAGEYQAIDANVRARWPGIVRRFGPPSDLDGNGRIIVFVSHTVASNDAVLGYVDPCNLGLGGRCKDRAEIIYVRSLESMAPTRNDVYTSLVVPHAILHETIHLLQAARGWSQGQLEATQFPIVLMEGEAEAPYFDNEAEQEWFWGYADRIVFGIGSGPLSARRGLAGTDPMDGGRAWAFTHIVGGLFFQWLREKYGDGVDQALMGAFGDPGIVDPVRYATGVPGPLALGMMYASLYFEDISFGYARGLDLGQGHVRRWRSQAPYREVMASGDRRRDVTVAGCLMYELRHETPVRVTLHTSGTESASVYVLVAQP